MSEKKLYRSRNDRVIAGVCAGVGKYLDVDPVIIRLIWAATILLAGTGIFLYVVAWIIMPEEPVQMPSEEKKTDSDFIDSEFVNSTGNYTPEKKIKEQLERERRSKLAIGVGIVIVGIIFLFSQVFSWTVSWRFIIGILLILAGGAVLLKYFREDN